jgi:hypothetical protein
MPQVANRQSHIANRPNYPKASRGPSPELLPAVSSPELWAELPSVSAEVFATVFPAELSAVLLGELADELQAVLPTEPSVVLCPELSGLLWATLAMVIARGISGKLSPRIRAMGLDLTGIGQKREAEPRPQRAGACRAYCSGVSCGSRWPAGASPCPRSSAVASHCR